MDANSDGIEITRERVDELRQHEEAIVTDRSKSALMKELELAGVRSMIAQLEGEIREGLCARQRMKGTNGLPG